MARLSVSTLALWDIRDAYPLEEGHDVILGEIREAEKRAQDEYDYVKVEGIELGLLPKLVGKLKINSDNMDWVESLPSNTIHGVYDEKRKDAKEEKEWYKRLNAKNIVYHPDTTPADFVERLLDNFEVVSVENMDNKKKIGRTIASLEDVFEENPELKMTLDINHSIIPAFTSDLITRFSNRIVEIHCSGVDFMGENRAQAFYDHIPLASANCHPLARETLELVRGRLTDAVYVIESELVKENRQLIIKEMSLVQKGRY